MTKTLSGNKRGLPYGEIVPRRSTRAYSPSSAGFDSEAIRRATEASLHGNLKPSKKTPTRSTKGKKWEGGKMKRTQLVTPDGKTQTPLAKLRSRFGYDTGVPSEGDSETSELANTKKARMPKTGAHGNMKTSDEANRNRRIKMIASHNDTGDETSFENVAKPSARQKQALLKQFYASDDDDSIPDSMFPGWVQESSDSYVE
jgi:hypothetical protein